MILKNTNQQEKTQLLSPKIDVVFQALFGEVGSEKITKRFLENILEEKIEQVDLSKNPIIRREHINEKAGVLDVVAYLNENEVCDIELQVVEQDTILERILFYWSKLYSKQINKGEDYNVFHKTIVILISNFEINRLKDLKYHTKWRIIEENERKTILTDKLEIHILELPKITSAIEEDELIDWLSFLENPESKRVEEKMENNEELQKAKEKLNTISEDEYMQWLAEKRADAIRVENGLRREIREGKAKGLEEGRKEGRKEGKLEIAKKMLEERIPLDTIIKITGLSKEEITKTE